MNVMIEFGSRSLGTARGWRARVGVACGLLAGAMLAGGGAMGESVVFDFSSGGESWTSIDDVVMGGRSASEMVIEGGLARFRGHVSLENNGGFASVRSAVGHHDLSAFDGIRLRVIGDGRSYGFRLRTDPGFDGVSYQAAFATEAGRTTDVRLPFAAFEPRYRGRQVPGHPALDPARIRSFGLIIAERQSGPFELRIESIAGYGEAAEQEQAR